MSTARQHPFVLSFDAVANLESVFKKLGEKEYRAAHDSGHKHLRPELHLPVQFLVHGYKHAVTNVDGRCASMDFVQGILRKHHADLMPDSDGDMCVALANPYVRLVLDGTHDIKFDSAEYGPGFEPTQLVIAHANRLNELLLKTHTELNPREIANGRRSIIIVTNFPATIAAALGNGFEVWNYSDGSARLDGNTPFDICLMEAGVVEVERSGGFWRPVLYTSGIDAEVNPVSTDAKPASSDSDPSVAPGWQMPD